MRKVTQDADKIVKMALYIRVSTDRQAEEGYSIEVQTERLIAFSKTQDGEVSYELYIDDGFSGASLDRPAMQRLVLDAKNKVITHVCVYMEMTAEEIRAESSASPVSLSETLKKKQSAQEIKLRRLYDLYAEAGNRVLLDSINELTEEIKKLGEKIDEEETRGLWSRRAAVAKEQLRNIKETWSYMDIQEQRNLICSVIDKITVTHNSVRIDYKY